MLSILYPKLKQAHNLSIREEMDSSFCFDNWENEAQNNCFENSTAVSLYCFRSLQKADNIYTQNTWCCLFPCSSVSKESACSAEDPGSIPGLGRYPEKEMVTCFSILAWKISWTEEPGGLQSMGSQRVRHDWAIELNWTSPNTFLL